MQLKTVFSLFSSPFPKQIEFREGILHHAEGVDLMPSSIQLSGMEVSLVNAMSRETILRQYLDTVRKQYTSQLRTMQTMSVRR